MNSEIVQNNSCPRTEIAEFLDGELGSAAELEFERHVENCGLCEKELKRQEKLLCVLNASLQTANDLELPANFTEIIISHAENGVSGLRRPRERFNALLICFGLILLSIAGFGGKISGLFDAPGNFLEQTAAVGNLIFRFVYDIALGVTIVLRSLCSQFVFKNETTNGLLLIGLFVSSLIFVRLLFRYKQFEN